MMHFRKSLSNESGSKYSEKKFIFMRLFDFMKLNKAAENLMESGLGWREQ